MKESILHYVWQHKLFSAHELFTTTGDKVDVIDVGKLNTDAGPDFFNAKIQIGDTLWAGNVEIHTLASDWKKHQHHTDTCYDSVILHVVARADEQVYRMDGEAIPQCELSVPPKIECNYDELIKAIKWVACADEISDVPSIIIQTWKTALLTERLNDKISAIEGLLQANQQHWEDAFYITLARNFGFGVNSQAFECLAKSLPLSVLAKHKSEIFQLEALLFGQSGLLSEDCKDDYSLSLKKEYTFLQHKYGLSPVDGSQWKLLRLRPDNFPHVKIAQFAALIHKSSKLFSKIVVNPNLDYLRSLFACKPSAYWQIHYLFGKQSHKKIKELGTLSVNGILINTVVPYLFCYAEHNGKQDLKDKALELLEQLPAERNAIVLNWQKIGLEVHSASDSQALLQLKKQYCEDKKCLRCRIGHKVLTV